MSHRMRGRQGALQTCGDCLRWSAVKLLGEHGFSNGGVQGRLQEEEEKIGVQKQSVARGR